jgi:hypothetical protein
VPNPIGFRSDQQEGNGTVGLANSDQQEGNGTVGLANSDQQEGNGTVGLANSSPPLGQQELEWKSGSAFDKF